MVNITLIATFYSAGPLMPAALAFSPTKIILVVDVMNPEVRSNIAAVEKTFESVAKVEVQKVKKDEIYEIAKKLVEIIDKEDIGKNNKIVVNVSGGWRVLINGVLYGCYARAGKVHRIVINKTHGIGISDLPKLSYNLTQARREVLMKVSTKSEKSILDIANELHKTRGMVYQHLRDLKDSGYVNEDYEITDAGRLALL
jgi:CRISPR locus-related DNA-binding protein